MEETGVSRKTQPLETYLLNSHERNASVFTTGMVLQ